MDINPTDAGRRETGYAEAIVAFALMMWAVAPFARMLLS
jgi:hypothetical protein